MTRSAQQVDIEYPNEPRALIERIYNEDLGFLPTNKSIKPVHVANGFGRALTARSYDTKALAQLVRRYVEDQRQNVLREANTNDSVLAAYGGAFAGRSGDVIDAASLGELRSLAYGALAADRAVFAQADKSSFTLSNERFITRDPSDFRAGVFLSRLVTAGGSGQSAAEIRRALMSEVDPWTVLASPMLQFASQRDEEPTSSAAQVIGLADSLFALDDSGNLSSPTLRNLRIAYDRLARLEAAESSTLNSLRRLVLFGCFVLHVHVLSRWSEVDPGKPRPPILLDLFDGARPALRDASRATVRAAGDAVEGLLTSRITGVLSRIVSAAGGVSQVIAQLPEDDAHLVHDRYEALKASGEITDVEALADAYLDVGLDALPGSPRPIEFLTELGRRAGYMTPWANQGRGGKLQKRYGVNAEFLEVLVAALVPPNDEMEFAEFLDVARDQFGVVVGRPQDDVVIRRNNLNSTPFGAAISVREEDLRANVQEFRRAIEEIGYAKRYADGRTLITTTPDRLATA